MKIETLRALRDFVEAVKYRSRDTLIISHEKSADNVMLAALDAEIAEAERKEEPDAD